MLKIVPFEAKAHQVFGRILPSNVDKVSFDMYWLQKQFTMSYKREMEKAIKGYLAPFGFKYEAKYCSYVRMLNEDIEQSISYADETHYRNHYFFLRVSATVSSKSLNEILYEITDGKIDFRDFVSTPAYLNTLDGMDVIHTEFIGDRPMSENIESFANMFQYDIQTVFDKFKTQKEIYLSPIREKYFNPSLIPDNYFQQFLVVFVGLTVCLSATAS